MAITDNLVVGYKLDEASGNALDVLASNDLTANNAPGSGTGKVGNCRTFDSGSQQSFSHASNSTFQTGDIDWGIIFWCQLASNGSFIFLVAKDGNGGSSGDREYSILYNQGTDRMAAAVFRATDSGVVVNADSFGSPPLNTWMLVTVWHNSTADTLNIKINNGATDSQATGGALQAAGSAGFYIGQREGATQFWHEGLLDEAYLLKRVLSDDDSLMWWNLGDALAYPWTDVTADATSNSGYQSAASSLSWSHSWHGYSKMLAIDVHLLSVNDTVTAVTYGGATCTLIGATNVAGGTGRVESWRILQSDSGAPASGSSTISVTISGSLACAGTAVSYANVHQSSPTEAFTGTSGINVGAADATVSVTTVTAKARVHGALSTNDTSVTANQKSRNNVTGAAGSGANEDTAPVVSPGATTISYTGVGALAMWAIQGYGIRPVGAVSPSPFPRIVIVLQAVNAASTY